MGLMERVSALIRANLNELIDKAEDPEKIIKNLILDMENQLIQVKTQAAVAITDQHMLDQKQKENEALAAEWMRKAELAVDKEQDDLARAALERHRDYQQLVASFKEQVADQVAHVEALKATLLRLESKLSDTRAKSELLIAQRRRARSARRAQAAQAKPNSDESTAKLERMKRDVVHEEAVSRANNEMMAERLEDKLDALEKEDEVERLLAEIKNRRQTDD